MPFGVLPIDEMPFCPYQTPFFFFQNKQGPPPHPYVPRSASGRPGGKPPTSRGCVKRTKGKGKKGKKGCRDTYDLIVNIDLVKKNILYIFKRKRTGNIAFRSFY